MYYKSGPLSSINELEKQTLIEFALISVPFSIWTEQKLFVQKKKKTTGLKMFWAQLHKSVCSPCFVMQQIMFQYRKNTNKPNNTNHKQILGGGSVR